jgi:hypothetical protein
MVMVFPGTPQQIAAAVPANMHLADQFEFRQDFQRPVDSYQSNGRIIPGYHFVYFRGGQVFLNAGDCFDYPAALRGQLVTPVP